MKTLKVNHVIQTLRMSPAGVGDDQKVVDERIDKRLAEGYDDVECFLVKTNFDERMAPTDVVLLYVFKKYGEDAPAARSKKE